MDRAGDGYHAGEAAHGKGFRQVRQNPAHCGRTAALRTALCRHSSPEGFFLAYGSLSAFWPGRSLGHILISGDGGRHL